MKLSEIAHILNGKLTGDPDIEIKGVAEIKRAGEGDITFVAKERYLPELKYSRASAVILQDGLNSGVEKPYVLVKNPYLSLISLLEIFYPTYKNSKGIDSTASIKTKRIGRDVTIHPFVCIEDESEIGDEVILYPFTFVGKGSTIGKGSIIYSNVNIYHNVSIGERVIIHSGAVIGSDGFGFVRDDMGKNRKIPQIGNVVIEDDVEIGANVCIDRATLGSTVIKRGVKIDNLVQIAHNVVIGNNTVIAGQTGISGSCTIGENVIMGGQVGTADHLKIGDGVILAARSGVMGDIEEGLYSGLPAMKHILWKKIQVGLSKLPELIKRVRNLEKRLEELKNSGR